MDTPQPAVGRRSGWRLGSALVLLGFYALAYFWRPDSLQAVHWWPLALWTPVMLMPWFSLRPWRTWKPMFGVGLIWLVMLHFEGELPMPGQLIKDSSTALVVTLNCAGGSVEAAREAFEVGADLVLLQEVGSKEEFVTEAHKHGYDNVVWSIDDAIFSNSQLTDPLSKRDYAAATWEDANKGKHRVVSLRLHPPTFRLDLWNPDCWHAYAEDARLRRERFAEIAREANLGERWIVGGDFNATNRRIVQDTCPTAQEAMRTRASTWIGTGTNDYPLAPVDQIWSPGQWSFARVQKTRNSDHRMVIAETSPLY